MKPSNSIESDNRQVNGVALPARSTIAGTINLAAVSMSALLTSLAVSIVTISLQPIADSLRTSPNLVSSAVIVYLLVLTGLFLFFGKLGDVHGYREVFLVGVLIFTTGSVLCGTSANVYQLVMFRVVQAVGGAMITAVGPAYVARYISADRRGIGMAFVTGGAVLGLVLGPPVGLFITDVTSWRWLFFLNVPISIALFAGGYLYLPKPDPEELQGRFDLIGTILFGCALTFLVLTISSIRAFSWHAMMTLSLILFSFAFWTLAIVYERCADNPALDFTLFGNPHFTNANISLIILKMVFNGPLILYPFYLHLVLGYSYGLASLMLIVPGIAMLLTCPIAGLLSDRFGSRPLCITGAGVAAGMFFLFSTMTTTITLPLVVAAFALLGFSRGVFHVPNSRLILDHSPQDKKGTASGMMKALSNSGITFGVVFFQFAFVETILAGEAVVELEDAFTLPVVDLVPGFHAAFMIATILSLIALVFSWRARDPDQTA